MRRLSLQIYLTFVGILCLFGVLLFVASALLPAPPQAQHLLAGIEAVLGDLLPGPERPPAELQTAVERLGQLLPVHLAVRSADGTLLASVGEPLPVPPPTPPPHGRFHMRWSRPVVALTLADNRLVVARWRLQPWFFGRLGALSLLPVAIALGAYPVVRRLTRRLERLQRRVDALRAGDFTARVEVEGHDEVARLAQSFNLAVQHIERLVNAQRSMLAGASHELRTPLTRIRLAIELLPSTERPELHTRLTQDIAELDALIGELLLASRLDTLDHLDHQEEVDILALLAEEAVHTGAEVSGTAVCLQGDPRMLRRLIRNLLDNAHRYAAGTPVEATVEPCIPQGARLCIADRGPGIPSWERDRIFEPFYRPTGLHTTTDGGGVGLGLALVRQIARHHGGEVRCVAREGGGICFEVELRTRV